TLFIFVKKGVVTQMAFKGNPVGNMVVRLSLDETNFRKSVTGLNRQIKTVNSTLRAQLSQFDKSEKSVEKYSKQIKLLEDRYKLQGKAVDEHKKRYDELMKGKENLTAEAEKEAIDLNNAIAKYEETGRQISQLTNEMNALERQQDIQGSGWYKTGDALENFGTKLGGVSQKAREVGGTLTKGITLQV